MSGEALPFENETFDSVVSTWTLCSISDVRRALGEKDAHPEVRAWFVPRALDAGYPVEVADRVWEVLAAFGPDPAMQMYGRGLRRRLPSMLGGDQRRMRMVYSLVFSLPGTPVLFYGEEIGMAENLAIEGRYAVRSPMQWSNEPHAGFTTGDEPCRPLPDDGPFGYAEVNVARQRREPGSLLNWMERIIRRRRECPELGWGEWTLLGQDDTAVFAHRADWGDSTIVAVHNLCARATQARLALDADGVLVDLLGEHDVDAGGEVALALEPYDHRWFRLRRPGQRVAP